jgi:hypothetical protein
LSLLIDTIYDTEVEEVRGRAAQLMMMFALEDEAWDALELALQGALLRGICAGVEGVEDEADKAGLACEGRALAASRL